MRIASLAVLFFGFLAAAFPQTTTYVNGSTTQEGPVNFCGTDTGTATAYACANPTNATLKAYRVGNTYTFLATHANTGPATLAIDGLGAKLIKKLQGSADLAANDVLAGATIAVTYDGTYFELQTPTANTASGSGGGGTPGVGYSRDFYSASDYPSVQAACTAAGSTGTVLIPSNYAGTDKTWNCGSTQVIDYMASASTILNAAAFGLVGDGTLLTDVTATVGSASITSTSHCFVSGDVGKHVKIVGANNGTGPAGGDLFASINSVSSCAATLSAPAAGSQAGRALTGSKMFYGTDNTVAMQNMVNIANRKSMGASQIYFPAGIYEMRGPFYITTSITTKGDGYNASSLRQIDPTADLLIIKPPNVAGGNNAGAVPNSFQFQGEIQDLNLQGEGTGTTGNLLVVATSSYGVHDMSFTGHAGRGIYMLGERTHVDHIRTRNVRQALVTSPNYPNNESYLRDFDFMESGCVLDGEISTGAYWNYDKNSINGIFPGMNSAGGTDGSAGPYTITEDTHTAVVLDGVTNFVIENGSIKSTRCVGGVQIKEANGQTEVSHVYFENGTLGGYIHPSFVNGGQIEKTTLAAPINSSVVFADVVDGSWFTNWTGAQADRGLTIEGTIPGTNAYIRPPDYVVGGTDPSVLGGGILTGTFEMVTNYGGYHDTVGSGWHMGIGRRTGSIAWPAGAVYEQLSIQPGNQIVLSNDRLHSAAYDYNPRYQVTCDSANDLPCGEIINGLVPDDFFAHGGPNQLTGSRGLKLVGETQTSGQVANNLVAGVIDCQSSCFIDSTAGMISNSGSYRMVTGNNTSLVIPEFSSAVMKRPLYNDKRSPFLQFWNNTTSVAMTGAAGTQDMTGYTWNGQAGVQGSLTGPFVNFTNGMMFGDQMYGATANPTHEWKLLGDTATAGFLYQIWNANTSAYTQVFNLFGSKESATAAAGGPYAKITENLGSTVPTFGMALNNSLQLLDLTNPAAAPTVTPTIGSGGAASTTYSYVIVGYQADGGHTAASPVGTTTVGPVTLSVTDFNTITWANIGGAEAYYNVYRTAGGGTTGLINTTPIPATATMSFVDTGLSGSGSAPSVNTSGCLLIGSTSTTATCGGKLDVIGDTGTIRAMSTGNTLEFTNPSSGTSGLQADGSSFTMAVGGASNVWTFNSSGSLIASKTTAPVGGTEYYMPPIAVSSNTTATTSQQWYVCTTGTITLPAAPVNGDEIYVTNIGTGTCTIAGNGFGIGNAVTGNPTTATVASGLTTQVSFDGVSATNAWRTLTTAAGGGGSGNATTIQSVAVAATAPTSGQVLSYNGTQYAPTTIATVASSGGFGVCLDSSGNPYPCVKVRTTSGTLDTINKADCGNSVHYTSTSAVTVTLTQPTVNMPAYCPVKIVDDATGGITISANSATIAGQANYVIPTGASATNNKYVNVYNDGTNYFVGEHN